MERLQKVIAASGICSRRKAEELIIAGKVKVNGKIINELGVKVSDKDKVEVNNVLISKEEKVYFLLNKPRGVVTTTTDDKNRKTVVDFIQTNARIYPVGRLDYDTTGVLLLTNDGEFANIMMHPSNVIDKVYVAKIKGIIKGDAIHKLEDGVIIDEVKTAPARVKLKKVDLESGTSLVKITIHEGKNHQVKNMFESVGFPVLKLKRESEGIFDLTNLKSGQYRKLTPKEVARIYSLKEK